MEYIGGDELPVYGSGGGVNIGDGANVVVGGDIVGGDKISVGHISGNGAVAIGRGAVAAGKYGVAIGGNSGPVVIGDGVSVDMRGTVGAVYRPSRPVVQHFGDVIIKDE
jgi:hypothetical protein